MKEPDTKVDPPVEFRIMFINDPEIARYRFRIFKDFEFIHEAIEDTPKQCFIYTKGYVARYCESSDITNVRISGMYGDTLFEGGWTILKRNKK